MLIERGPARSLAADRRLACSLAVIAGALNGAGFYALGLYSSHMTGNIAAVAGNLALGDLAGAAVFLGIVSAFILGAILSTLLINAGERRGATRTYVFSLLAEAGLLAALGCADLSFPALHQGPLLAIGLALLMGVQNAIVTRISNARVRTTHVTGMITDIGIELGHLADIALGRRSEAEATLNLDKLRLHVAAVSSFFAGGVLGVLLYAKLGALLLLGSAACLLILALPGVRASRIPRPGNSLPS